MEDVSLTSTRDGGAIEIPLNSAENFLESVFLGEVGWENIAMHTADCSPSPFPPPPKKRGEKKERGGKKTDRGKKEKQ